MEIPSEKILPQLKERFSAVAPLLVSANDSKILRQLSIWGLVLFFTASVFTAGWVSDDAFITFRTIDNLISGFGLRWNVFERVQTFTHPLWLLLELPLVSLSGSAFWASIGLSIFCSSLTFYLLLKFCKGNFKVWLMGVFCALSQTIIDFATSGLETPLSWLLLTCFFAALRSPHLICRRIDPVWLIAALLLLTRLDFLLIVAPCLVWYQLKKQKRSLSTIALSGLPLILWSCFAVVYYGTIIPNTGLAKLGASIPRSELINQGLSYLHYSFLSDIPSVIMVALFSLVALKSREHRPAFAAAVVYVCYVVWVGGDFMLGRFMFPVLAISLASMALTTSLNAIVTLSALFVVIGFGFRGEYQNPFISGKFFTYEDEPSRSGIAHERRHYYWALGTGNKISESDQRIHPWQQQGERFSSTSSEPTLYPSVGLFGYYAGPNAFIIDPLGITNPYLSRLPSFQDPYRRPGHYERVIPYGMVDELRGRIIEPFIYKQKMMPMELRSDMAVSRLFRKVFLLASAPLFSWERWQVILESGFGLINFSSVDPLRYTLSGPIFVNQDQLPTEMIAGEWWNQGRSIPFGGSGITIRLDETAALRSCHIYLDSNDEYLVRWIKSGKSQAALSVQPLVGGGGGMQRRELAMPAVGVRADLVEVRPIQGDGRYALGPMLCE